jgi:hypothetical protein
MALPAQGTLLCTVPWARLAAGAMDTDPGPHENRQIVHTHLPELSCSTPFIQCCGAVSQQHPAKCPGRHLAEVAHTMACVH